MNRLDPRLYRGERQCQSDSKRITQLEAALREIKSVCKAADSFANPPAVVVQIVDEVLGEKS